MHIPSDNFDLNKFSLGKTFFSFAISYISLIIHLHFPRALSTYKVVYIINVHQLHPYLCLILSAFRVLEEFRSRKRPAFYCSLTHLNRDFSFLFTSFSEHYSLDSYGIIFKCLFVSLRMSGSSFCLHFGFPLFHSNPTFLYRSVCLLNTPRLLKLKL